MREGEGKGRKNEEEARGKGGEEKPCFLPASSCETATADAFPRWSSSERDPACGLQALGEGQGGGGDTECRGGGA